MIPIITSISNPRINKIQTLHTPRGRKKHGLFLMEGPHLITALLDEGILPYEVYFQPNLLKRTNKGKQLLDRLFHIQELTENRLIEVNERVMNTLGDTQTSQGVVSVLPLDAFNLTDVRQRRISMSRPAMLILDDLADPGNMGTILRTALAANVDTVLLTPNCVDYYSPKVVRAAAGAHIALPVEIDVAWPTITAKVADHCRQRVFLAEAASEQMYYDQDFTQPFALIIGNEAHGPSLQARALAVQTISIPLFNNVESLNAALACGIILYEALRQISTLK